MILLSRKLSIFTSSTADSCMRSLVLRVGAKFKTRIFLFLKEFFFVKKCKVTVTDTQCENYEILHENNFVKKSYILQSQYGEKSNSYSDQNYFVKLTLY